MKWAYNQKGGWRAPAIEYQDNDTLYSRYNTIFYICLIYIMRDGRVHRWTANHTKEIVITTEFVGGSSAPKVKIGKNYDP